MGQTALLFAAKSGCAEAAVALLPSREGGRELTDGEVDEVWGALREAAGQGHNDVMIALLEATRDSLSRVDEWEVSGPLVYAASRGRTETVELLVQRGGSIWGDSGLSSALLAAAGGGHVEVMRLLLDRGVDPNGVGSSQEPPLFWAAASCNPEALELLLGRGADPMAVHPETGHTALTFAVARVGRHSKDIGVFDVVRVIDTLLQAGTPLDARDFRGMTALLHAAETGSMSAMRALVEKGADVTVWSDRGESAVWFAASVAHLEMLQLLLASGAPVSMVGVGEGEGQGVGQGEGGGPPNGEGVEEEVEEEEDREWRSALMVAMQWNFQSALVDLVMEDSPKGPPQLWLEKQWGDMVALAEALLAAGAEVDTAAADGAGDIAGWTALMFAARSGSAEAVRTLVQNGAAVNAKDKRGRTALGIVCCPDMGRSFAAASSAWKGFEVEEVKAAFVAMEMTTDLSSAVEALVESGADVNVAYEDGTRALHQAAWRGLTGVVAALIKAGAEVNARGGRRHRPWEWSPSDGAEGSATASGGGETTALAMAVRQDWLFWVCSVLGADDLSQEIRMHFPTVIDWAAEHFREKQLRVMRLLLEGGARDDNGDALREAARWQEIGAVRKLLGRGERVAVDARDEEGETALMACLNRWHQVRLLVARRMAMGIDAVETEAIEWLEREAAAVTSRCLEVARELLSAGGAVDAVDRHGATPLMHAFRSRGGAAAMMAVSDASDGLEMSRLAETGLHGCALEGAQVARALVGAGADVNARDKLGRTALMVAAAEGDAEGVAALLEMGAEVDACDAEGWTALMHGSGHLLIRVVEMAAAATPAFFENHGDVLEDEPLGRVLECIMSTVEAGAVGVTRALLAAGADVAQRDSKGRTALVQAGLSGSARLVEALLEAGSDPRAIDWAGGTFLGRLVRGEDGLDPVALIERPLRHIVMNTSLQVGSAIQALVVERVKLVGVTLHDFNCRAQVTAPQG